MTCTYFKSTGSLLYLIVDIICISGTCYRLCSCWHCCVL